MLACEVKSHRRWHGLYHEYPSLLCPPNQPTISTPKQDTNTHTHTLQCTKKITGRSFQCWIIEYTNILEGPGAESYTASSMYYYCTYPVTVANWCHRSMHASNTLQSYLGNRIRSHDGARPRARRYDRNFARRIYIRVGPTTTVLLYWKRSTQQRSCPISRNTSGQQQAVSFAFAKWTCTAARMSNFGLKVVLIYSSDMIYSYV